MNKIESDSPRLERSILIAYYLTLAAFFVASFFPQYRVWGISWWAYFPLWVRFLLLAIGAVVPLIARRIDRRVQFYLSEATRRNSEKLYWILSSVAIAILCALFWLCRNQTHFLGDGYQILTILQQGQSTHKFWDLLTLFIQRQVFSFFYEQTVEQAKAALQLISVVSGAGLIAVTLVVARKLGLSFTAAWTLAAGLFTSGASLLFFGYIETYPLFAFAVTTTCLIGLLVSENKISRWWLLFSFIFAMALHLFAVALTPAILYLWLRPTKLWQQMLRINLFMRLCAVGVLITATAAFLMYLAKANYVLRFWFVPPIADRFTVESYTLFSPPHLADMLNLLILLLPCLLLLSAMIYQASRQRLSRQSSYRFLIVAFICSLVIVFVLDPKLGMPRDWDLFSFAGIPLTILGYMLILDQRLQISGRLTVVVMSFVLGALVLIPRVVIFALQNRSVRVIKSYIELDHTKSKNIHVLLGQELERWGRIVEAKEMRQLVDVRYPEFAVNDQSSLRLEEGRIPEAISLANHAIRLNPIFPDAYNNLGSAYVAAGKLGDALEAFHISYGLNPRNVNIRYNIANAYARSGNIVQSQHWLEQSLNIDSTFAPAIIGTAMIAISKNQMDELPRILNRLSISREIDPVFLGDLVRQLLRKNRYDLGARAITIDQQHGLDSATVARFVHEFPQLATYLR